MRSAHNRALAAGAALLLAWCAPACAAQALPPANPVGPEADYPVVVGDPYVIGGVTYTPADTLNYDAVGYARAGTVGVGISGAHHVLPLPCYVEVTSLDSGHTILVRLDRRGPMNGKQLIELSPAAWAQLGLAGRSDAPVRVRRVNPPEPERALLREGKRAPERMETPPGLRSALRRKLGLAIATTPDEPPSTTLSAGPDRPVPPPSASRPVAPVRTRASAARAPAPARPRAEPPMAAMAEPDEPQRPAGHQIIVQVAAFASRDRAQKVAARVGGTIEASGHLFRVHIIASGETGARAALVKAREAGYAGAIILHHD